MKTFVKLFSIFSLLFALNGRGFSQTPSYTLTVSNFHLQTINAVDDAVEFDIYLLNLDATTPMLYAGGQFDFTFNNQIAPVGELAYSILPSPALPSVLPPNLKPRNPNIFSRLENGVTVYILATAGNVLQGCDYDPPFFISTSFPGTLVARMRLMRTTGTFNVESLNLQWRHEQGQVVFAVTRLFQYFPLPPPCTNTEITNPNNHIVEPMDPDPLPVELASFNSSINRNNVILNWTTTREINNSRFEIERNASGTTDWITSGNIAGNGTTEDTKSYSFSERLSTGKYNYRLKQIDFNGNFRYYNLSNEVEVGIPDKYNLSQNYPNPFNPTTKIDYDLPLDGKVNIVLYDVSGREILSLLNEVKTAGYYTLLFNASNLASGIYFYRITAKDFVASKKMVVLK